jgi:guanosine-3',5'-bis(diphosphate) 3'-pyrophosphohydrolase
MVDALSEPMGDFFLGSPLELCAKEFATKAHEGQLRKYTGDPYIVHPAAVVEILREVDDDPVMLAAAWLHDVVEDTPVTIEEIEDKFGFDVAGLVRHLTDVSKPSDGNRATRKALDREHLAAAPARAQTIKLADIIDNAASISAHDPEFAKVYKGEALALIHVLRDGDSRLRLRAFELVDP